MTAETLLAFDFGERRIGVAVGNSLLREATALEVIDTGSPGERFARIAALIETWQPTRLVVGNPLAADGSPHAMTQRATRFANQLQGRFKLPVLRVDERYSSVEAEALRRDLRAQGRWRETEGADHLAAQIILQQYFEASHVC